jgi:hypothetical protein
MTRTARRRPAEAARPQAPSPLRQLLVPGRAPPSRRAGPGGQERDSEGTRIQVTSHESRERERVSVSCSESSAGSLPPIVTITHSCPRLRLLAARAVMIVPGHRDWFQLYWQLDSERRHPASVGAGAKRGSRRLQIAGPPRPWHRKRAWRRRPGHGRTLTWTAGLTASGAVRPGEPTALAGPSARGSRRADRIRRKQARTCTAALTSARPGRLCGWGQGAELTCGCSNCLAAGGC